MELFDGYTVEKYQLQFKGSFSADEVDVDALTMDDDVCLMVIATVGESVFKHNNEGEIVRVNKLEVVRAVELEAQVADYALAKQAATAGNPMLPNFSDPDDDDMHQPDDLDVEEDSSDLDEPYEVLPNV